MNDIERLDSVLLTFDEQIKALPEGDPKRLELERDRAMVVELRDRKADPSAFAEADAALSAPIVFKPSLRSQVEDFIYGPVLVGVGILMLLMSGCMYLVSFDQANWTPTKATVTGYGIYTPSVRYRLSLFPDRDRGIVSYEYPADGKLYSHEFVVDDDKLGFDVTDEEILDSVVRLYPSGSEVDILVNPKDVSRSTHSRSEDFGLANGFLGMALFTIGFGMVSYVMSQP